MINYSVSARKNPRNRDEDPLFYANPQLTEVVSLEEFSNHISSHNSKYGKADVIAVLTESVDCLREMLLDGKKVQLGDMGSFSIGCFSRGAITAEDFTPSIHIKDVHVNWSPSSKFKDLKEACAWNLVASREAQQKLLKAIAAGETTVDISKPKDEEDEEGAAD